jgi:hypothetical protein
MDVVQTKTCQYCGIAFKRPSYGAGFDGGSSAVSILFHSPPW